MTNVNHVNSGFLSINWSFSRPLVSTASTLASNFVQRISGFVSPMRVLSPQRKASLKDITPLGAANVAQIIVNKLTENLEYWDECWDECLDEALDSGTENKNLKSLIPKLKQTLNLLYENLAMNSYSESIQVCMVVNENLKVLTRGYDLSFIGDNTDLPEKGKKKVVVKRELDGGLLVRIFDKVDEYTDYDHLTEPQIEIINSKINENNPLSDQAFIDKLTTSLSYRLCQRNIDAGDAKDICMIFCQELDYLLDAKQCNDRYICSLGEISISNFQCLSYTSHLILKPQIDNEFSALVWLFLESINNFNTAQQAESSLAVFDDIKDQAIDIYHSYVKLEESRHQSCAYLVAVLSNLVAKNTLDLNAIQKIKISGWTLKDILGLHARFNSFNVDILKALLKHNFDLEKTRFFRYPSWIPGVSFLLSQILKRNRATETGLVNRIYSNAESFVLIDQITNFFLNSNTTHLDFSIQPESGGRFSSPSPSPSPSPNPNSKRISKAKNKKLRFSMNREEQAIRLAIDVAVMVNKVSSLKQKKLQSHIESQIENINVNAGLLLGKLKVENTSNLTPSVRFLQEKAKNYCQSPNIKLGDTSININVYLLARSVLALVPIFQWCNQHKLLLGSDILPGFVKKFLKYYDAIQAKVSENSKLISVPIKSKLGYIFSAQILSGKMDPAIKNKIEKFHKYCFIVLEYSEYIEKYKVLLNIKTSFLGASDSSGLP